MTFPPAYLFLQHQYAVLFVQQVRAPPPVGDLQLRQVPVSGRQRCAGLRQLNCHGRRPLRSRAPIDLQRCASPAQRVWQRMASAAALAASKHGASGSMLCAYMVVVSN